MEVAGRKQEERRWRRKGQRREPHGSTTRPFVDRISDSVFHSYQMVWAKAKKAQAVRATERVTKSSFSPEMRTTDEKSASLRSLLR